MSSFIVKKKPFYDAKNFVENISAILYLLYFRYWIFIKYCIVNVNDDIHVRSLLLLKDIIINIIKLKWQILFDD